MSVTQHSRAAHAGSLAFDPAGVAWFLFAVVAALPLFWIGFTGLAAAWARPEYSHGPVIPCLSFYIFLREMRDVPPVEPARSPTAAGACWWSGWPCRSPRSATWCRSTTSSSTR